MAATSRKGVAAHLESGAYGNRTKGAALAIEIASIMLRKGPFLRQAHHFTLIGFAAMPSHSCKGFPSSVILEWDQTGEIVLVLTYCQMSPVRGSKIVNSFAVPENLIPANPANCEDCATAVTCGLTNGPECNHGKRSRDEGKSCFCVKV